MHQLMGFFSILDGKALSARLPGDGCGSRVGLDYSQRNTDIERIYSGERDADALLRQYGVDYVLIGPAEFAAFKVNEQFWSQYDTGYGKQVRIASTKPHLLNQGFIQ